MRLVSALIALALLTALPLMARERGNGPEGEYYRSTDGQMVHRPTRGANSSYGPVTATCLDGSVSYSHHHQGTCSRHGGVAKWGE